MRDKLEKILKNKLAEDILRFFYENQGSIDTAGGISTWVHKSRKEVLAVLDDLVKLGVLEEDSMGRTTGYCYTRDQKIMSIVEKFMNNE